MEVGVSVSVLVSESIIRNGAFTLPGTETDTDTDKLAQNPTGICVGVYVCAV